MEHRDRDVGEEPPAVGRVTFEWMGDKAFVLERWTVPVPEAPNGLAVIGWDEGRGTFLQHYFDERAVARVYEMGFEAAGRWSERSPTSRTSSSRSGSPEPSPTAATGSTTWRSPTTTRRGRRTST